jgi:shikimate kinase
VSDNSLSPRCIIIGPPGAGKSTVGQLVAERLHLAFRDTDEDVVVLAGKPVTEIFVVDGESVFREIETRAVSAAIVEHEGVLALGGGAVIATESQDAIRRSGAPVIFLDVGIASAAPRVGFNRDRPLLLGNPRAQWLALMSKRRPIYSGLATHVVSTDDKDAVAVAEEVVAILEGLA